MTHFKKMLLLSGLIFPMAIFGQTGDGFGDGEFNFGGEDSANTDTTALETLPVKEAPKPYVRFAAPYDTLREMIYYSGVVEDVIYEESTADSLYWRFKKYLTTRFGAKTLKEWTEEDKRGQKFIVKPNADLVVSTNEFNGKNSGSINYTLTMRFQDGRFKWEMSNFVHVIPAQGISGGENRVYAEYYYTTKRNIKSCDLLLIAIDNEVKNTVKQIKKSLRPPFVDEVGDDW